jgi:hypothetical protein
MFWGVLNVRSWGISGRHLLLVSVSQLDPERTSRLLPIRYEIGRLFVIFTEFCLNKLINN